MKEIEKTQIKLLSDRLDLIRHQMTSMQLTNEAEKYAELEKEKAVLETEIVRLKALRNKKLSKEAQKLEDMPFKRPITKKEQADLGKLKKSVRGLIIVHPMTALGREMELDIMTGFAKHDF
ncbi:MULTISPECIES: YibL family ribosome-associated protein [Providencia]|uniref:YibL family ribosome-associated protein n=1 Tax=Providencia rettgeri TaxID=587 RepID=A0AAD2VWJ7_PRORE|nr:YibL family ribosome-associated protein [Providencia rettgeri]ELR5071571.1 YibL family ribosome-associated protein [Providencia rettgeri]ELR5219758.1 YibL family ribosome-associated protein [Providencia rettgeri]ELR5223917.1 YibL family ribosome-associated protein [Providencia rettgeri]MDX7324143.1 YibL family ribosome-associated protein [Providencia rettgeri]UPS63086.1 YibL family ribosome-associated protein [Providencia rettgeri]